MDIYVKIDGGIGRVISATGVVDEFARRQREQHNRTVNVVSSYPQLCNGLPHINRCYHIGMPYLYEDYILKGEFLEPEPYNNHLYYKENEHLATVFNHLLNGERVFIPPRLVLTDNEKAEAKQSIADLRKQHGKKIMLLQAWGSQGGIPLGPDEVAADESYRSFGFQFYQALVAHYKSEYLLLNVQGSVNNGKQDMPQFVMRDTIPAFNPDVRKVLAIIPHVDVIVACDSYLHHATAALGNPVPTIVLWGGTDERNLGYEGQTNIRTVPTTLFEPNRVPHDRAFYVSKNKGCNDFDLELVMRQLPAVTPAGPAPDPVPAPVTCCAAS